MHSPVIADFADISDICIHGNIRVYAQCCTSWVVWFDNALIRKRISFSEAIQNILKEYFHTIITSFDGTTTLPKMREKIMEYRDAFRVDICHRCNIRALSFF